MCHGILRISELHVIFVPSPPAESYRYSEAPGAETYAAVDTESLINISTVLTVWFLQRHKSAYRLHILSIQLHTIKSTAKL